MPIDRARVWSVLADFPNIADWNAGVTTSFATSESVAGVGAQRHCDLSPTGSLEETIVEWAPEETMVVRIDSASKLPIRTGLVTFSLRDDGNGGSTTRVDYRYEPKWGPIGRLLGPVMDGQLKKGFSGFLTDLESAATARSDTGT